MKILAIDIETRPSLAYIWSLWDQNVGLHALVESGEMISFASKWIGEDVDVEFMSVYHDSKKKMIKRVWQLLDEADAVVHFNGKKFDIPHIQREFIEAGYLPPSPFKQIDLMTTCKSQFRFLSNKLAYVSEKLGLGGKVEHEGFQLWVKCMNNDKAAWEKMKKYNIQDTVILEELYEKLKPWIKIHPSHALLNETDSCPRCNSTNRTLRGVAMLSTGNYQRYCCKDCGGWYRSTTRIGSTTVVAI